MFPTVCLHQEQKRKRHKRENSPVPAVEDSLYVTGWAISQPLTSMVLKTPRYRESTCCYEVRIKAESEGSILKLNPHFINQIDFLHMQ